MKRRFLLTLLVCSCFGAVNCLVNAEDGGLPSAPSTAIANASVAGTTSYRTSYLDTYGVSAPTFGLKVRTYLHSTYAFRNLLEAGLISGIPDLSSAPEQPQPPTVISDDSMNSYTNAMDAYGTEMDTWRRSSEDELRYRGRRFAVGLATAETRQSLSNLVLPTLLHQDPRYVPANIEGSFGQRMWQAVRSIAITHNNSGNSVPNYSKLGGTIAAGYLGQAIYARQFDVAELHSGHFAEKYIAYSLGGDLATNTGRELIRTVMKPDIEMAAEHGPTTQDSYYPLSVGGKFVYWARSTYYVRNFVQGALLAGIPDIPPEPAQPSDPQITSEEQAQAFYTTFIQYGNDLQSWRDNMEENVRYHERRLIGGISESETQQLLSKLVLPTSLAMDPRYIPLGAGHSGGARFANALAGVVVGRMNSGHRMLNLPLLGGTAGAAFIAQNVYYPKLGVPELETNRVLAKTIGFNLGADALLDILGEFFPRKNL